MDPTLSDLLSYALVSNATFYFCGGGEHPVLYRMDKGRDQLVLPSGGVLQLSCENFTIQFLEDTWAQPKP